LAFRAPAASCSRASIVVTCARAHADTQPCQTLIACGPAQAIFGPPLRSALLHMMAQQQGRPTWTARPRAMGGNRCMLSHCLPGVWGRHESKGGSNQPGAACLVQQLLIRASASLFTCAFISSRRLAALAVASVAAARASCACAWAASTSLPACSCSHMQHKRVDGQRHAYIHSALAQMLLALLSV